jgi:cell division protease FtsH
MGRDAYPRPYSDETSTLIDNQVRKMLETQYQRAQALLIDKRAEVELLAKELLDKEVLSSKDLVRLIGPRPVDADKVSPVKMPGVVDNTLSANGSGPVS